MGQVVADGVREDEVTVGQALHEGGSAETVAAVVGEVRFADGVQARDGGLEVVVHPETAHGVVDGRIDHHRLLPRGRGGDLLVHLEEVAVALFHALVTQALDGVGEIEEHGEAGLVHAVAGVAALLGGAGSDVTGNQVAEGRIAALQVVVAALLRNLGRLDLVLAELEDILHVVRHPDAAVVPQGLGHQGELALLVAMDRDTGRVDLREAGVREESALAVGLHRGGTVGVHRVRGQEIGISVTTGGEDHGVGAEALDLTGCGR